MHSLTLAFSQWFTPRGMAALGQSAGLTGLAFVLPLAVAGFAVIPMLKAMRALEERGGCMHEPALLERHGSTALAYLPFAARSAWLVFMGTSLLTIAGYSLNEVFFRWYPNLGASFTILGFLTLTGLTSPRMLAKVAAAGIGFAVLTAALAGLAAWFAGVGAYPLGRFPSLFTALTPAFLLILGWDIAWAAPGGSARWLGRSLVLAAVLLFLLGQGFLGLTTPDRLAETTVPHIRLARELLGGFGRQWMGLAVITGSFGAFAALLWYGGEQASLLGRPARAWRRGYVLLACGAVGVLMATGYAGEPVLEGLIAGSAGAWLLGWTAILGAAGSVGLSDRTKRTGMAACTVGIAAMLLPGDTAVASVTLLCLVFLSVTAGAFLRSSAEVIFEADTPPSPQQHEP